MNKVKVEKIVGTPVNLTTAPAKAVKRQGVDVMRNGELEADKPKYRRDELVKYDSVGV